MPRDTEHTCRWRAACSFGIPPAIAGGGWMANACMHAVITHVHDDALRWFWGTPAAPHRESDVNTCTVGAMSASDLLWQIPVVTARFTVVNYARTDRGLFNIRRRSDAALKMNEDNILLCFSL
jgi:hypothetical protein